MKPKLKRQPSIRQALQLDKSYRERARFTFIHLRPISRRSGTIEARRVETTVAFFTSSTPGKMDVFAWQSVDGTRRIYKTDYCRIAEKTQGGLNSYWE